MGAWFSSTDLGGSGPGLVTYTDATFPSNIATSYGFAKDDTKSFGIVATVSFSSTLSTVTPTLNVNSIRGTTVWNPIVCDPITRDSANIASVDGNGDSHYTSTTTHIYCDIANTAIPTGNVTINFDGAWTYFGFVVATASSTTTIATVSTTTTLIVFTVTSTVSTTTTATPFTVVTGASSTMYTGCTSTTSSRSESETTASSSVTTSTTNSGSATSTSSSSKPIINSETTSAAESVSTSMTSDDHTEIVTVLRTRIVCPCDSTSTNWSTWRKAKRQLSTTPAALSTTPSVSSTISTTSSTTGAEPSTTTSTTASTAASATKDRSNYGPPSITFTNSVVFTSYTSTQTIFQNGTATVTETKIETAYDPVTITIDLRTVMTISGCLPTFTTSTATSAAMMTSVMTTPIISPSTVLSTKSSTAASTTTSI